MNKGESSNSNGKLNVDMLNTGNNNYNHGLFHHLLLIARGFRKQNSRLFCPRGLRYNFTILLPSQMVLPNPESESTRGHEIYSREGDRVHNA